MTIREFEAEFRRLYLPLGMYALRIVGNTEDAEDAVQNVFAHVWELIESGMDVKNFKAYMYRSVRNECLGLIRCRRDDASIDDCPEVADEDIDTSERDAAVWRAVDSLPDACREIFLMSKRDGMTNDEIAFELGLSVKTVKNQLTKAFSRLRTALSPGHRPFFLPFL